MKYPLICLHPQKHRRVQAGHPWVYSNEIVMDADAKALPRGAMVEFHAHDGAFLGIGSFNAHSLISGRIFTPHLIDAIDEDWLSARIENALALRDRLVGEQPYYRLIHAEADGIPGLIVDRFNDVLCVQLNTAGVDALWPEIQKALRAVVKPKCIVLRNDAFAREMEGLTRETKVIGDEFESPLIVRENGLTYFADLRGGQKTGWYFDQRDNHALVARYAAKAESMLDLYTHAGGFAIAAAHAGAKKVVAVDSSEHALDLAKKAAAHGGYSQCEFVRADVFEDLEKRIAAKEVYEVVVADPPAFVKSRKDLASGARGYRKLAKMSAKVTKSGGILFIASCSHNMELPMFIEQVALGLSDAKCSGKILHTCFAAPDHPVHPMLPESAYLKGLLISLE